MTDRELLELAAKAAGPDVFGEPGCYFRRLSENHIMVSGWNPLTDDGDALRLAVKLGMFVDTRYGNRDQTWPIDVGYWTKGKEGRPHESERVFAEDKLAATRRAIVRAAAEIGRSME